MNVPTSGGDVHSDIGQRAIELLHGNDDAHDRSQDAKTGTGFTAWCSACAGFSMSSIVMISLSSRVSSSCGLIFPMLISRKLSVIKVSSIGFSSTEG